MFERFEIIEMFGIFGMFGTRLASMSFMFQEFGMNVFVFSIWTLEMFYNVNVE